MLRAFYELLGDSVRRITYGEAAVCVRKAEALGNVLLSVPVGALLPLAFPGSLLSLLLAAAAAGSLGIEVVQYFFLPERVPSLLDVLLNTGGAAIGSVVGSDVRLSGRPVDSGERGPA
jgi:glycopeptide antibiotics resistance protein